jgi:hypothetical protein
MPSREESLVSSERRRVCTREREEVSGVWVVRSLEMWDQACEGMVVGEAVFWEGWWGAKMHWGPEDGGLMLEVGGERDGRWRVAGGPC